MARVERHRSGVAVWDQDRNDATPGYQPWSAALVPALLGAVVQPRFRWASFDVNACLPADWKRQVSAVAEDADFREFPRPPVLSREAPAVAVIPRGRVQADQIRERLPWLYKAYRDEVLELANEIAAERVSTAQDDRYGIVLNVQHGTRMRFECHVDSNPLTGLLFCTDHVSGGELVVANNQTAEGIAEVDRDCTVIRPRAGQLIFFDARRYPHYARKLTAESETRIVAVMNFYTESCPESSRPSELNRHLYGDNG